MTKQEVINVFDKGNTIYVDGVWTFYRTENGSIWGCCGEPNCCAYDDYSLDEFMDFIKNRKAVEDD